MVTGDFSCSISIHWLAPTDAICVRSCFFFFSFEDPLFQKIQNMLSAKFASVTNVS